MCLDRLDFLISSCHSGFTVLASRAGWRVAGDLVPQEAPHGKLLGPHSSPAGTCWKGTNLQVSQV